MRLSALEGAKKDNEAYLAQFDRLREHALATGNVGAAVLAHTNKGKAEGRFIERHEHMHSHIVTDAEQYIQNLLQSDKPQEREYGQLKAREWGLTHLLEMPELIEITPEGSA